MHVHTHLDVHTDTQRQQHRNKKHIQIEACNTAQRGTGLFSHFDSPTLQVIRLGIFGSETTPDVSQKVNGKMHQALMQKF